VTALLCVAHGSRDPRHGATIEALVAAARQDRPDLRLETAYLDHCAPSVGQAVSALEAAGERDVVVVPLLLSAAYHSKVDVPGVLRDAGSRHPRIALRRSGVLGPHPLLLGALRRRLGEAGVAPGDPGTAVVLASAGTSDAAARALLEQVAAQWQAADRWGAVVPAYASASPPTTLDAVRGLRAAGWSRVAVASYFLAPGFLPDRARAGGVAAGASVVTDVLGAAPELATLLLHRFDQAVCRAEPGRSVA
jgi:sirohydrochlorin ferrochelatase